MKPKIERISILLAILTWWIMLLIWDGMFTETTFPLIVSASATIATLSQYRNFKRLATYHDNLFETI